MRYTHAYRGYSPEHRSAQQRVEESFGSYVWAGVILSALLHFALLNYGSLDILPDMSGTVGRPMQQLETQPPVEIPPPPEAIARPAVPVISTRVDIDETITIASVTFQDNPVSALPAPTLPDAAQTADEPTFTPYEVKPELRNPGEIQRALEARYPRTLRDAGIGGRSILWVYIDEAGAVKRTRLVESTGHAELDVIAQDVMREFARFSPAYNRDQRVPVWIQIPVSFTAV